MCILMFYKRLYFTDQVLDILPGQRFLIGIDDFHISIITIGTIMLELFHVSYDNNIYTNI